MSHSTTATSTYLLTKYSRAYPPAEWQHFTNPVVRLVLDTTKRSNNQLDSVRLRILWNMSSSVNDPAANADMEDLELLSFSSLLPKVPQKQPAQGLPLKAIYRDTTVGIRYLYPCDNVENPCYRRFQIAFQTTDSTLEFIRSIRAVCPCKATPQSMNGPTGLARGESLLPPQLQAPSHVLQVPSGPQDRIIPFPHLPSGFPRENRPMQTNEPSIRVTDFSPSPSTPMPSSSIYKSVQYSALNVERLVSDVIREDGFVALLENLDKLWKIKALVGTERSDNY
ncbi:hypothetical protein BDQ17DRAFT_1420931 [Cyathus striatus]|nr:hypothetical protein BDQ17DRAFT_1420931 [Cyathus striatus]